MASRQAGPGTTKRSVTLRNDVDAGIQKLAGRRGYSAFLNDAAILALQAQAVGGWISDYEKRNGPLTADDDAWAQERLAAAHARMRK